MPTTPPIADREIVVAAYDEDLSWLHAVPWPYAVYTKGTARSPKGLDAALWNVGKEAHSYLHHIVERYETLAEVTFFVQGSPYLHAPDLDLRWTIDYPEAESLALWHLPGPDTFAFDRFNSAGLPVSYPSVWSWMRRGEASLKPFVQAAWRAVFACPFPDEPVFGLTAQWAVPRARLVGRSREFWRWLRGRVVGPRADGDRIAFPSPECLEVLWYYLFADAAAYPHHPQLDRPA